MKPSFDLQRKHDINDLIEIMHILRSEDGCPWDKVQTHESIRQDCLEEAYEVCEAIDNNNNAMLKEELGDLLLQVVFHTVIEEENMHFDFNDVTDVVSSKLIHRHPHVFDDKEKYIGAEKYDMWESAKREEHGHNTTAEALDGVAHTLPSIWRASKIVKKARKAGYNKNQKLDSASEALIDAVQSDNNEEIAEKFSAFMFSLINHIYDKIDLEKVMQNACDQYINEFRDWEISQES